MPARAASASRSAPGVAFEARGVAPAPAPLRTDVAGLLVRAARGPVGEPLRVEGWREYERVFGGVDGASFSAYAARGYFENGGRTAWVVRAGRDPGTASANLDVSAAAGLLASTPRPGGQVLARALRVEAASPGPWANDLDVKITLRSGGAAAAFAEAALAVERDGAVLERLHLLDPLRIVEEVNARSAFVRLAVGAPARAAGRPPSRALAFAARLDGGRLGAPGIGEYLDAARRLVELPEPALLVAADARGDLGEVPAAARPPCELDPAERFYVAWAALAAEAQDRFVLVDAPRGAGAGDALALAAQFGCTDEGVAGARAAAIYHPWIEVPDPAGGPLAPTRAVPPSGHVAGLTSRLDRERGAYHSAANAPLVDAVDLGAWVPREDRQALNEGGVNLLRCQRGRGVVVFGARTADPEPSRRFLAHRRLLHRLVRAMRAAAEPLVFESNGPMLRLALVRALTSVLLEAFRAGALRGARAEEAFVVRCDETTNPPDAIDRGVCAAEVSLAAAPPMELIHLVVTLAEDGSLRVLE